MGYRKLIIAAFAAGVIVSCASVSAMADTGWQQNDDGYWRYYTSDNEYVSNAWKSVDGNWYYFEQEGYALTNKWATIDGKLYHFDNNGHMEKNKWIDFGEYVIRPEEEEYAANNPEYAKVLEEYRNKRKWRYVGSDGAAYIGWKKVDGEWYFFNDKEAGYLIDGTYYFNNPNEYGMMHYGWLIVNDDVKYHFDGNGRYRKNCWYKGGYLYGKTAWYYFGSDGVAASEWKNIGGKWYFFGGDWSMYPDMKTGKLITFNQNSGFWMLDDNGCLITKEGWHKSIFIGSKSAWQYVRSDGSIYHNEWLKKDGNWYYFDHMGNMVSDSKYLIDGKEYIFNSSGICTNPGNPQKINGWYELEYGKYLYYEDRYYKDDGDSEWMFFGSDGKSLSSRWINTGGNWYYLDRFGYMVHDSDCYLINGKLYDFDHSGKCKNPNPSFNAGWNKFKVDGEDRWAYFENGSFCTGWKKINNNWYYFNENNGLMAYGSDNHFWLIDGKRYHFNEDGVMTVGWHNYADKIWNYHGSDGAMYENQWLKYKDSWYYFDAAGTMCCNVNDYEINGKYYSFDSDGKCLNP